MPPTIPPAYQLNITIPCQPAGLNIILMSRVGVLSLDKSSVRFYFSVMVRVDNLRK